MNIKRLRQPNHPAQVGLIKRLGGRICNLSGHQLDLLAVTVKRQEMIRRKKAAAWQAYKERKQSHGQVR